MGEAFREALHTLRTQWVRSALTLFGIVWGTASVVFLVSWGLGVRSMMEDAYGRVGKNFVAVWGGIVGEDFTPAVDRRALWLTADDVAAVRAGVRRADIVVGEARKWSVVSFRERSRSTNVRGIEAPEMALRGVRLAAGRPITMADVRHRRRVAVVADDTRRDVLGAAGGVGSWIRIDGLPFQVVGILSRVGTQLWQDGPSAIDEEVWVPITALFAFGPRWGHDAEIVDMIGLRLIDRHAYDDLDREVRAILAPRLGVSVTDKEAIRLASPIDSLKKIPMDQMDGLLFVLGAGTLLIGGVGVLTMMLDAVHDRRQEIGVRLAVGARRRDVLGQFLLETAVIAGVGGVLGLALGVGGCWALARLQVPDLVPQPILRGDVIVLAIGVLTTVAFAAGCVPAWRASRVDPSITLRAE